MSSDDAFDSMFEPDGTPIISTPAESQAAGEDDPFGPVTDKELGEPDVIPPAGDWIIRAAIEIWDYQYDSRSGCNSQDIAAIIAKHAPGANRKP